ncbi:hypothetical protein [Dactylosporangium sp. NPDC051541]|uniref:hypothetical protein n=1 Tax=Dactylosporangium sp. NPDC051541 TaxID=3363977 RepID=UPI0037AA1D50
MTQPDGGRDLGRLLDTLVPDLAAPPDRLAAIGHRVRRRQRRTGLLAAACVALVLLGGAVAAAATRPAPGPPADPAPSASTAPQHPGAGDCPAAPPDFNFVDKPPTAPGDLAPPGAVRVVYCRYNQVPDPYPGRPGPPRRLVLTRDVAGLITVLNALPAKSGMDPCMLMGDGGGYLTLEYADGSNVTIERAPACGYVRRGGITRYEVREAVEAFDARFIAQELAVARPADVRPADCAARLTTGPSAGHYSPDPAYDVWMHTTMSNPHDLPVPLAVVTACRFVRGSDGHWDRARQVDDRGVADETGAAVVAAAKATMGQIPYATCSSPGRTVDVLLLRDVVGETREVRVARDTCPVVTIGFEGSPQSPALDRILDRLLGPV